MSNLEDRYRKAHDQEQLEMFEQKGRQWRWFIYPFLAVVVLVIFAI